MAKQIKFFRGLEQEDQISLLKGAVVEVLILRSSKMFSGGGGGGGEGAGAADSAKGAGWQVC